jgi:hypothetical protein
MEGPLGRRKREMTERRNRRDGGEVGAKGIETDTEEIAEEDKRSDGRKEERLEVGQRGLATLETRRSSRRVGYHSVLSICGMS